MTRRRAPVLTRRRAMLAAPALLLGARAGWAAVPAARVAALARGINLTNWFRFPASQDRAFLEGWITDAELRALRGAGFNHVRLCVDDWMVVPDGRADPSRLDLVRRQVQRLQQAGLAVIVVPFMRGRNDWLPETDAASRDRLVGFWAAMGPALSRLPADMTFPEIVNEPVYRDQPEPLIQLIERVARTIRVALPGHTILASPGMWGGVEGLPGFRPVSDANVVYSLHSYEPQVFAVLASNGPQDLDRTALARLPWPIRGGADCAPARQTRHEATRALVDWFCSGAKDRAFLREHFAPLLAFAARHGVVVHLGEFGVHPRLTPDARRAFVTDVVGLMEEARIGWALWGYEDSMGLGRRRAEAGRPLQVDPTGLLPALGLRPVGAA